MHLIISILSLCWCCISLSGNNYSQKFEGSFESWHQKKLQLLSLFLPKSPMILQAGGHYGDEMALFAFHWPKSKIFSFEPNPHAFQSLSLKASCFNNVRVFNFALNDYSGIAPFYICYGSSGHDPIFEHASSILKPSPSMEIHYQGPIIDVQCVLLDDWCEQNEINHIDFMCLNLQGAELQILKSSPLILKTVTCMAIHTHFFPFRIGTTQYKELKQFMEESGFQLLAHWYREGLDGDAIFVKKDYFLNKQTNDYLKNNHIDDKYQRYYEPFFKVNYDLDHNSDTIKDTLKMGLAYEGNIGIIIQQLTRPGSIALDIGSHIGIHTIVMSRAAGPQGGVIAFEPNKKLYMELLHQLTINGCNNIIPIAKALSDEEKIEFLNHIHIVQDESEIGIGDSIDTIALDSLNIENLSIIKLDVEHYEYFVLKGAKETIIKNKPVIIFECWIDTSYDRASPKLQANFDRVVSLIESYGYEIYVIYRNDFIAFPIDCSPEIEQYKKKFIKLDYDNFDLGIR